MIGGDWLKVVCIRIAGRVDVYWVEMTGNKLHLEIQLGVRYIKGRRDVAAIKIKRF